jgi:hypothetical protein
MRAILGVVPNSRILWRYAGTDSDDQPTRRAVYAPTANQVQHVQDYANDKAYVSMMYGLRGECHHITDVYIPLTPRKNIFAIDLGRLDKDTNISFEFDKLLLNEFTKDIAVDLDIAMAGTISIGVGDSVDVALLDIYTFATIPVNVTIAHLADVAIEDSISVNYLDNTDIALLNIKQKQLLNEITLDFLSDQYMVCTYDPNEVLIYDRYGINPLNIYSIEHHYNDILIVEIINNG